MVRVLLATLLPLTLFIGGCAPFTNYGEGYSRQAGSNNNSRHYHRKQKPPANKSVRTHKVRKGDTLYSIAWQYGYDVRTVAAWNGLRKPYTIYPGQKLTVRPKKSKSSNEKYITKKSATANSGQRAERVESNRHNTKKINWSWPTQGKIISRFAASDPARQGIDISGRKGQPVKAAAKGQVVYSGSGLRGYGKLVIIKHNETYFSAYAHNNKVRVKEGDIVKSGQRIADMGNSGAERVMLHFEIRRNGKPSNPLKYLPK